LIVTINHQGQLQAFSDVSGTITLVKQVPMMSEVICKVPIESYTQMDSETRLAAIRYNLSHAVPYSDAFVFDGEKMVCEGGWIVLFQVLEWPETNSFHVVVTTVKSHWESESEVYGVAGVSVQEIINTVCRAIERDGYKRSSGDV
jgi:hypothetical protein